MTHLHSCLPAYCPRLPKHTDSLSWARLSQFSNSSHLFRQVTLPLLCLARMFSPLPLYPTKLGKPVTSSEKPPACPLPFLAEVGADHLCLRKVPLPSHCQFGDHTSLGQNLKYFFLFKSNNFFLKKNTFYLVYKMKCINVICHSYWHIRKHWMFVFAPCLLPPYSLSLWGFSTFPILLPSLCVCMHIYVL